MTATEYFESQADSNTWLLELPESQQLQIKQMLAEFALLTIEDFEAFFEKRIEQLKRTRNGF